MFKGFERRKINLETHRVLAETLERNVKKPGKKNEGLKFVNLGKDESQCRRKRPVRNINRLADESWSMKKNG